jgi:hypothetical protein
MDVVTKPKRPWTIKWAVGILVFLNILGDIYTIEPLANLQIHPLI